jgi:hypothetical protein
VLIDCDDCAVRDLACGDCVVTVLLGLPDAGGQVDAGERRALDVLADSGLVPRLRLVPLGLPPGEPGAGAPGTAAGAAAGAAPGAAAS